MRRAGRAGPAGHRRQHRDPLAHLPAGNAAADLHDLARVFVAELNALSVIPLPALGHRQVGAADPAAIDADQQVPGTGHGIGDVLDDDGLALTRIDCRFHIPFSLIVIARRRSRRGIPELRETALDCFATLAMTKFCTFMPFAVPPDRNARGSLRTARALALRSSRNR